jgi:hypothetical protein
MFVIDWILSKFNYHKFYKVDVDALFAEFDKQDAAKPAAAKKRPARKVAAKKPAAKKVATARKKV